MCRISAGDDQSVRTTKKASEKLWLFYTVEMPSNGRAITTQTDRFRILSAYKYAEDMNAKLA